MPTILIDLLRHDVWKTKKGDFWYQDNLDLLQSKYYSRMFEIENQVAIHLPCFPEANGFSSIAHADCICDRVSTIAVLDKIVRLHEPSRLHGPSSNLGMLEWDHYLSTRDIWKSDIPMQSLQECLSEPWIAAIAIFNRIWDNNRLPPWKSIKSVHQAWFVHTVQVLCPLPTCRTRHPKYTNMSQKKRAILGFCDIVRWKNRYFNCGKPNRRTQCSR